MLLLGAKWDARKAEAKNLINAVLPTDGFDAAVMEIAQQDHPAGAGAVKTAKMLINLPPEDIKDRIVREGGLFAEQLRTDEFKEAATAFMERRAPDFSKVRLDPDGQGQRTNIVDDPRNASIRIWINGDLVRARPGAKSLGV
jgi:1,4-dihydroxy-2-naphthoyl-CoA synthase